jgi:hypothetical protein
LNSLGYPLSAGTFRFDKGDSHAFLYTNLSGGEKAAFDLLLDILIKRKEFAVGTEQAAGQQVAPLDAAPRRR